MEGFEWLREEPDLNRLATIEDIKKLEYPTNSYDFDNQQLGFVAAARMAASGRHKVLTYLLDRIKITDPEDKALLWRLSGYNCERVLIDKGINFPRNLLHGRHDDLFESRTLARSSAILILYAMYEMDKKYKNVSVIISRVIWASRGHCENWLQQR